MDLDTLAEDVKGYTVKELEQLLKMTEEVRRHWKSMLENKEKMNEGLGMALELSVQEAENDLKLITSEMEARAKK